MCCVEKLAMHFPRHFERSGDHVHVPCLDAVSVHYFHYVWLSVPRQRKNAAAFTKRKPLAKKATPLPTKPVRKPKRRKQPPAAEPESKPATPAPAADPEPATDAKAHDAEQPREAESEPTAEPAMETDLFGLFATDSSAPPASAAPSSDAGAVDLFADSECMLFEVY